MLFFSLKGELEMNKKVTIIPSTASLQKALGTEKDTYKCLGIFPSIIDLRQFEFFNSIMSTYNSFEMVGSICCDDYNNYPKSKFLNSIKKSKIDVVICNLRNDINVENIPIPVYCLNENTVINNVKITKL